MLKPTASYKMSKQTKIAIAKDWNNPLRGQIRRAMIDAELSSRVVVRRERKDSRDNA